MKVKQVTAMIVGGVLIALTSFSAGAQTGTATTDAAQASTPNTKAVKAANRALQKDVSRALHKIKGLDARNLTVRARGGVVTLLGTVPDQSQIAIATQTAQGVAGVSSVTNALRIRQPGL